MNLDIPGDQIVRQVALVMGLVAEGIAVVIIAAAVAGAAWTTLAAAVRRNSPHPWVDVRLDLARWLALALEFLLAADVIKTAVAPTWQDIGKLAAIAVIRTGLNFFLQRDVKEAEEARQESSRNLSGPT